MNRISKWMPWLAGVFTLVVYGVTACRRIDPLLSARLVAEHLGLTPFAPMSHPLWGVFIRLIDMLPFSLAASVNFFSALSLAVVSGLLFHFMTLWPWDRMPEKYRNPGHIPLAGWVSGWLASIVFTISLPVWVAGTRALPIGFDMALLMLSLALLLQHARSGRSGPFLLFSLLWGVGITEYDGFIILSPFVFLLTIVLLLRRGSFRIGLLLPSSLLFLAGLSIYFIEALAYMKTPAYAWREFEGLHQVLWYTFREQYLEMKAGLAAVGWLLIFCLLILPWLLLVLLPFAQRRKSHFRAPAFFLFTVMIAIAIVVLFNLPPSPWALTQLFPLVVLPYLFFAFWTGRLGGLFFLVGLSGNRNGGRSVGRVAALIVAACLFLAVLMTAAFRNYVTVRPEPGDALDQLAGRITDHLNGRDIVVVHDLLSHNLLLAARERNLDIRLINPGLGVSKSYRRYVASLFKQPRLQNLAVTSLNALMEQWRRDEEDITARLAIVQPPDAWARMGYTPVPLPFAYMGMKDMSDHNPLIRAVEFWENEKKLWDTTVSERHLAASWVNAIRTMLSQINNNLGVALEECGEPKQAATAYQTALELDEENLSALMNRTLLLRRDGDPQAEELEKELNDLVAAQKNRHTFWSLSSRYGYIRDPGAYMAKGYSWAISGKPAAAMREIRQAINLSGESPAMKLLLAHLHVNASEPEAGRATYESVLGEDPNNLGALIGMAHLAVRQNQMAQAQQYLDRLKALDVDINSAPIEGILVALATQSGDYEATKATIKAMLKTKADASKLWATLALLANEQNDKETLDEAVQALESAIRNDPFLGLVMAQIELRRGNFKLAQDYLTRAIRARPTALELRQQLLQVYVNLRQRDDAEAEATAILEQDPAHAFANYIMGTIQESRSEDSFAENSYRASLATARDPYALNDLAWLLARKGRHEEALPLVEESLQLLPANPNALDTYGFVLMHLNRFEEAENVLRQAVAQQVENPMRLLHLAQLYEKMGLDEQALEIANPLLDRMHEIPLDLYDDARAVVVRIRNKTQEQ